MSEVNLVLEHLRAMRGEIGAIAADVREIKHRLTSLEISVANLAATEANHYASLASRADRADDRLARIERRLELVPTE